MSHDLCLAGLLLPLRQNTFNCGQVRKVFNLTIWIQQASAYVVCLDLRGSPKVSKPGVGGRAQAVDGAVGCGLQGMGGAVWPVLHGLQRKIRGDGEFSRRPFPLRPP